jgi:transposase-like protein
MDGKVSFQKVVRWTDEECRTYLEAMRWPDGPRCPKCGADEPWKIERRTPSKNAVRTLYRCRTCKRQFTATVGTIFEDSKIPLSKWFAAIYLMVASKKGISAHQLHRQLDITYKSAWFMCHRVREAMRDKAPTLLTGVIEADETYVGGKPRGHRTQRGQCLTMSERISAAWAKKTPVLGILERGGRVRTIALRPISKRGAQQVLREQIALDSSCLLTDESPLYTGISRHLPHGQVQHDREYVSGYGIHTQGIENYWSLLKRGLIGVFHHVSVGHLPEYLGEFEFRFNRRRVCDEERFASLMGQTQGRVLWYCQTPQPENPYA